ncbi:hypothetical protein FSP39_023116 [Pinctada imbricata]|uniref:Uncharacterized protein n=1 Tax=Pinctada imbricata TaxID=66713 RepID=A0AA89BMG2_PINIB|nr:hypothetical protein FSP39_023116 [Pinctada imbricata]
MYSPVKGILNSIANGEKHWSSENHFLNDLADARTVHGATQQLVKYQIEEHHMEAYARALAQLRKNYYQNKTLIRYGDQHYTQSYRKLLELYAEEGYHPTSQSLMYDGVDGLVTFILEENPDRKSPVDFKFYSDITRSRLDKTVNMNARYKRKLIYLDEADYFGRPIFSAIFEQDQLKTMLFNSGLRLDDMDKIIKREQVNGLLPRIICGYTEKGQLRYSVYLEK